MTYAHSINCIGLVFDIVGVVILFYYGPPALDITKDGHKILPFNSNNPEEIAANRAVASRHSLLSKMGLGLLGLGFVLQFVSNLVSD